MEITGCLDGWKDRFPEVLKNDMPRQLETLVDRKAVAELVGRELGAISDPEVRDVIHLRRVEPYPVERDWDYGAPGERYLCWTVLEHRSSNTGVAYCDAGFGPAHPWGLVFLSGPHTNIGMDSGWFATLEGAVRESMAWDGPNPPGYEVE
jgi:hypothetical protein